jgi:hypothetical protein
MQHAYEFEHEHRHGDTDTDMDMDIDMDSLDTDGSSMDKHVSKTSDAHTETSVNTLPFLNYFLGLNTIISM